MPEYLRGQLAELAEVNLETLRFYEAKGLLPPPRRSAAGYRLYTDDALQRLSFIKNAKHCGFTLREIQKALAKSDGSGIKLEDFVRVIDRKLASHDREIARREASKATLRRLKQDILMAEMEPHPEVEATLQELHLGKSNRSGPERGDGCPDR